jgi:hypothetical protein
MMLSRRVFVGGALASFVSGHEAWAQCLPLDVNSPLDAKADNLIRNWMPSRTPGLSLAVVVNGVVKCGGYGQAIARATNPVGATPQPDTMLRPSASSSLRLE